MIGPIDHKESFTEDIDRYLEAHQNKSLLRFMTCGSVDSGKSTLIGRLLYDSKAIFNDQLTQLETDSKKYGTHGHEIDFALLVDGLAAEHEQGITIDVAYRFFTTEKRKFIIADTPGHEQYTRNMVTAASTTDLAVVLVDARKGILTQTRRHSYLVHLMGVKSIVLAINKMDLLGYSKEIFEQITCDYNAFAKNIGLVNFVAIPISGLKGDNIISCSENMPWYLGASLIQHLETVKMDQTPSLLGSFFMPVQWVNRPNPEFRGFAGRISDGTVKAGDKIRVFPSGKTSHIARIVTHDGDLDQAVAGQSVTLALTDELDCSRGHIIANTQEAFEISNQFEATLIWMDERSLLLGRSYLLKIGTQTVSATISQLKYKINVNTLEHIAAKTLELNAIGIVTLTTDRAIPFTSYTRNKELGGFILIDKSTNATIAAGLIHFALQRASNIKWQKTDIGRDYHSKIKNQKPVVLWMTGISGSGKSSIANEVEKKLAIMGHHTFLLDGDNIRHGLNKDLGFTEADRIENIRRIGEVAKLMADAGLIVITAFISPFRAEREMVRNMMHEDEFVEIFIDTPFETAEKRDVKGLYTKARSGQLKNFTGISSPYEPPENADIHIDTTQMTVKQAAEEIINQITGKNI